MKPSIKMEHSSSLKHLNKISISVLVISLPLLYASLLHLTPSSLLKDTIFWFLVSNSIIVVVAADSGIFGAYRPSSSEAAGGDLYDEYLRHCRAKSLCSVAAVSTQHETLVVEEIKEVITQSSEAKQRQRDEVDVVVEEEKERSLEEVKPEDEVAHESQIEQKEEEEEEEEEQKECVFVEEEEEEGCSFATTAKRRSPAMVERRSSCGMEGSEYGEMSDEELNRRVEEFIRRFNSEIRMQERISAAVC